MSDDTTPHSEVLNSTAQGQIKSIVDRAERLEVEKAEIMEQLKELFHEAAGNGFDVNILKKVIRLRKEDRAKRQQQDTILEIYLHAVGEI